MWNAIRAIDDLLRGEATRLSKLKAGPFNVPAGGLTALVILLGAFHGFCMGWLSLFATEPVFAQVFASMVKVPALFLLTLLVTFPSLYAFNALVGSRFGLPNLFRLLIASMAVMVAVLASFGPIVAFFSITTSNYPFMVLLNVLFCAIAGGLGLAFLLQTLQRLTLLETPPEEPTTFVPVAPEPMGALDKMQGSILGKNVKIVFGCWIIVYGLVGAQMSWVLRPFIGNPDQDFAWFRPRESNFFEAVIRAFVQLFS
ncbi:MAG: hypothetical protein WCL32_19380 [Planctomycetota bacterium]